MARRVGLPAHLRGRVAVHRPVRLARAAARAAAAARGAAGPGADRPLRRRARDASPACSSATRTSTTRSTRRRSPAATAPRPTARRRSRTLMRLHGLGEQAVEVEPHRPLRARPVRRPLRPQPRTRSCCFGRKVPMDGELTCDHLDGLAPGAYRCGEVWGIRIEVAGISLYHQGSADLDDAELRDGPVDVFLAGVAGRSVTPRYWERILPGSTRASSCRPTTTTSSRRSGAPQDFVRRVELAAVPGEVAAAARDTRVAACRASTSRVAPSAARPGRAGRSRARRARSAARARSGARSWPGSTSCRAACDRRTKRCCRNGESTSAGIRVPGPHWSCGPRVPPWPGRRHVVPLAAELVVGHDHHRVLAAAAVLDRLEQVDQMVAARAARSA